jgi:hypothetical protein
MTEGDGSPRLTPTERGLVEWVAQASVGEAVPEPWRWSRNPMESVIRTLVELGVMAPPPAGSDWSAVTDEATASARLWLDEHPG